MDRTKELIRQAQEGDEAAKECLVSENTGLVWSIVKKFKGRGCEMDDLYQLGIIGLLKCIDKFDLSYDVRFSTYAVPMILGEIKRFLRDDGMIKVSRPLKELGAKAKYMEEAMRQKNGNEPTVAELAEALEIDPEELVMALEAGKEVESIYSAVYQGDGNPVYLIDKLEQKQAPDTMVDSLALKEVLGKLPPKERQIIILRYYNDKTQSEIAEMIGISQVQVSRIEKKVLGSIREKFG